MNQAIDLRGRPITVIGAGAIGGTVGAFLHEAGYNVTLVDVVEEHVQTVRDEGLRITGIRGERTFKLPALTPDELDGPLDVTLLCVKGHFTEQAIKQYAPLLADDGFVVSLQNGLNEPVIAAEIGEDRTVGCFVHFGADYMEPGLIQLGNEQTIRVGELDGAVTPRVEAVRDALSNVMPCEVTTNIWGYLWGKLVYGAMAFVVSTVDAPVPDVLDDDLGRDLARRAAQEAYFIGKSQVDNLEMIGEFDPNAFAPGAGWEVRADAALMAMVEPMRGGVKQHMGIWRDLKIKKRKTEVDVQTGALVEQGERSGIPTPVNRAVLEIVHEIENGQRGMNWENLQEIERRASSG